MAREAIFNAADLEAGGTALFGDGWRVPLARAMQVPRQSIDHYTTHGIKGTQAAAFVGVIASAIVTARIEEDARRAEYDAAEAEIKALHGRLAGRLVG